MLERVTPPDDLVEMGYIAGAHGIRGALKVVASTEQVDGLLDYPVWWLGMAGSWHSRRLVDGSAQPKSLTVCLEGVADRDQAVALRGHTVAVSRAQMPEPEAGAYYWTDLLGLAVINVQSESLGQVVNLLQTGANDVLVINAEGAERLIPFVKSVVLDVDFTHRRITVDWGLDY